jgi:hypothetical protein
MTPCFCDFPIDPHSIPEYTAMWDFNLLAATRAFESTTPFLLYRLAVCLGVGLGCLLAALMGAGTLIAFASFSANPGGMASVGAALGLCGFAFVAYKFRAGLFFAMRAGHLALLAELAKGAKLPQGRAQVDLAKDLAARRYSPSSEFFEILRAVGQVLQSLPARHCPFLGKIANKELAAFLGKAGGFLLQTGAPALLALSFLDAGNPWQSARRGLILNLRRFDAMAKNRFYLLGFEYLGLIAAYAAMLYPVDSAAAMLPVEAGLWRYAFALILAWTLKAAFLDPIATTALAGVYFDLARREGEETEAEARELRAASPAFAEIEGQAK